MGRRTNRFKANVRTGTGAHVLQLPLSKADDFEFLALTCACRYRLNERVVSIMRFNNAP